MLIAMRVGDNYLSLALISRVLELDRAEDESWCIV